MSAVDDAIKNAEFGDGAAWSDITGKPSEFPPESHTHNLAAIITTGATTGEVIKFNGADLIYDPVAWAEITSKPTEFTPSSHNHTVSNLTQSGATTGQLLQWNGTAWVPATIATGGKDIRTFLKTARQTITSSVTEQNDNHFTGNLKSSTWYLVEGRLIVSAVASGGFKFRLLQGNIDDGWYSWQYKDGANANVSPTGSSLNTSVAFSMGGSGLPFIELFGYIQTTSDGGGTVPFQTRWAQNTSNATGTFIERGSFISFTEV